MLTVCARREIPFVIASGRTYKELQTLFAHNAAHLLFAPLDGALAIAGDTLLCAFPLPLSAIADTLTLLPRPNIRGIAFCTMDEVFLYAKEESLGQTEQTRLGTQLCVLMQKNGGEIRPLPDVPIYKIVIYKKRGAYTPCETPLRSPAELRAVYDTPTVLELVREDVSKRRTAEILGEALHISPADMLVYGDGENDRELLTYVKEAGGRAVTVYGAKHDLFSITPYHTQNVADSVLRFLSDDDKQAEKEHEKRKREERIMKYRHGEI